MLRQALYSDYPQVSKIMNDTTLLSVVELAEKSLYKENGVVLIGEDLRVKGFIGGINYTTGSVFEVAAVSELSESEDQELFDYWLNYLKRKDIEFIFNSVEVSEEFLDTSILERYFKFKYTLAAATPRTKIFVRGVR